MPPTVRVVPDPAWSCRGAVRMFVRVCVRVCGAVCCASRCLWVVLCGWLLCLGRVRAGAGWCQGGW